MAAVLAFALLQDPVQRQIEESLREFEAAAEIQQALAQLSAQLLALGAAATSPIARRLVEDLRDGMASASVPALIDALSGRPNALPTLQAAFGDAATTAAGRIELADALSQLDDSMSWRAGIGAIAADPRSEIDLRLRALGLLLAVEDPAALEQVRALAGSLPERPPEDQRRVIGFLSAANTPETRDLLAAAVGNARLSPEARDDAAAALLRLGDAARFAAARRGLPADEPRLTVVDLPERFSPVSSPPRPPPKKKGDEAASGSYKWIFGAGALALALLLLIVRRRN
jgi:MYXO-CTERM domain-containing protein